MLLALSILWGGSYFFMALSLRGYPPFTIVLARVALAAVALAAACAVLGIRLPRGRQAWMVCLGMGVLNAAVPFSLILAGAQRIPSGLASVVNASTPVFSILLAHALTTDEKLTPQKLAGTVTGLAGVAVLVGPSAFAIAERQELAGILLCLAAALSYGLAGVWSRRLRPLGIAPLAAATGQCACATLLILPAVLLIDRPWELPAPPAEALAGMVGLGLLATALAYALFYRIVAEAGATTALLVTLLVPVTALLLGTLVLGEILQPRHLLGMAVIGAGLLVLDGRLLRWLGERSYGNGFRLRR
jgi:drug/metabolite transporter (DMT)-like permease